MWSKAEHDDNGKGSFMTLIHECSSWDEEGQSFPSPLKHLTEFLNFLWQLLVDNDTVKLLYIYYMASSESGQYEPNPVLWLAIQVGKIGLSCLLRTASCILQENVVLYPCNTCKSFIGQTCSFKMAGYWCVYGPWLRLGPYTCEKRSWPLKKLGQ